MELRDNGLWLSKRENYKDEVFLCKLTNFDVYSVTRVMKTPKPFVFAVKSTENLSLFENTADYLHTFCCKEKDGLEWMMNILLARVSFSTLFAYSVRDGLIISRSRGFPIREGDHNPSPPALLFRGPARGGVPTSLDRLSSRSLLRPCWSRPPRRCSSLARYSPHGCCEITLCIPALVVF